MLRNLWNRVKNLRCCSRPPQIEVEYVLIEKDEVANTVTFAIVKNGKESHRVRLNLWHSAVAAKDSIYPQ